MKDKAKKVFKVVRIVLSILIVLGLVISIIFNVGMHNILETEETDNSEIFQLKVGIAQCYLDGKGGLVGKNEGLYQDYLYSKNCKNSLNTAKWIASRIDFQVQNGIYIAEMNLLFNQKMKMRIDDSLLQRVIDNQKNENDTLVICEEKIDVIMHYDNAEKLFIVQFDYE